MLTPTALKEVMMMVMVMMVMIFKTNNVLTSSELKEVKMMMVKEDDNDDSNLEDQQCPESCKMLFQMLTLHKKIQDIEVEGQRFEHICSR